MAGDGALGLALGAGQLVAARVSPEDVEEPVFADNSFGGGTPEDVVDAAVSLARTLLGREAGSDALPLRC